MSEDEFELAIVVALLKVVDVVHTVQVDSFLQIRHVLLARHDERRRLRRDESSL